MRGLVILAIVGASIWGIWRLAQDPDVSSYLGLDREKQAEEALAPPASQVVPPGNEISTPSDGVSLVAGSRTRAAGGFYQHILNRVFRLFVAFVSVDGPTAVSSGAMPPFTLPTFTVEEVSIGGAEPTQGAASSDAINPAGSRAGEQLWLGWSDVALPSSDGGPSNLVTELQVSLPALPVEVDPIIDRASDGTGTLEVTLDEPGAPLTSDAFVLIPGPIVELKVGAPATLIPPAAISLPSLPSVQPVLIDSVPNIRAEIPIHVPSALAPLRVD